MAALAKVVAASRAEPPPPPSPKGGTLADLSATEKRRASLSVSLVDGAPVGVATGGGMPTMPEGVELKVIDGVPVAVPTEPSAAPPVGIVADDV